MMNANELDRIINLSALRRRKKLLERDIVEFLKAKIGEIERDFGVAAQSIDVRLLKINSIAGESVTIISGVEVDFDL